MKLFEADDLKILQNLSLINPSIVFRESVIRVMKRNSSVVAYYIWNKPEKFMFGIYDVKQFLSIVEVMGGQEVDVNIKDSHAVLKRNGKRSTYRFMPIDGIKEAPDPEKLTMPDDVVTISMEQNDIKELLRASTILNTPDIKAEIRNGKVILSTLDKDNKTKSDFSLTYEVDTGKFDQEHFVSVENITMLPNAYRVQFTNQGFARWIPKDLDTLIYIVAFQAE